MCYRGFNLGTFLFCRKLEAIMVAVMIPSLAMADQPVKKVFLLGGQSNMVSRARTDNLPAEWLSPQDDVRLYYAGDKGPLVKNTWVSLQPGSGANKGSGFGPELSFGRNVADAFPGEEIVLIKYAEGGTNLAVDWHPSGGRCYTNFMSTTTAALQAITDQGYAYEINAMLWFQGGSDGTNQGYADVYKANLHTLIANVRSEFSAPDMEFIIVRSPRYDLDNPLFKAAAMITVREAQVSVAENDIHASWFDVDSLPTREDGIHLNAASELAVGQRFADAYLETVPEPAMPVLLGPVMLGIVLLGIVIVIGCLLLRRRQPASE